MIRTIALRVVLDDDDPAYRRRQIHRWFAERFATPVWDVEHVLDEDYVLRHYYEARYEELRAAADGGDGDAARLAREDLAQERRLLSLTPEELVDARREEEAEAAEAAEYLRREQAREATAAAVEGAPPALTLDQLPPDVVLEFPVDLDRDPLGGGLLDD